MENIYHYCLSAQEVLCRDEEDYIRFINCYALALYGSGSISFADVVMSNHFHAVLSSGNIGLFSQKLRYSYTRYFNSKYKRTGILGEEKAFWSILEGTMHICTAVSYVLRNPLHHGICPTPWGYKYSSIKSIFQKEMGHNISDSTGILPKRLYHKWLPKRAKYPQEYVMESIGTFKYECFTNVVQTEVLYGTVRNFIYCMSRLSGEEWLKEQESDNNSCKPITLEEFEKPVCGDNSALLYRNEKSRNRSHVIQDLELCKIIDTMIREHFGDSLSNEYAEYPAQRLPAKKHPAQMHPALKNPAQMYPALMHVAHPAENISDLSSNTHSAKGHAGNPANAHVPKGHNVLSTNKHAGKGLDTQSTNNTHAAQKHDAYSAIGQAVMEHTTPPASNPTPPASDPTPPASNQAVREHAVYNPKEQAIEGHTVNPTNKQIVKKHSDANSAKRHDAHPAQKHTVYTISLSDKQMIAQYLMQEFHVYNREQLSRCLVLPPEALPLSFHKK